MKKEALKLIIKHFDGLENSVAQAEYIREEHIFCEDENDTAYSKLGEYIRHISTHPYLGWNKEIYPKFIVEEVFLK